MCAKCGHEEHKSWCHELTLTPTGGLIPGATIMQPLTCLCRNEPFPRLVVPPSPARDAALKASANQARHSRYMAAVKKLDEKRTGDDKLALIMSTREGFPFGAGSFLAWKFCACTDPANQGLGMTHCAVRLGFGVGIVRRGKALYEESHDPIKECLRCGAPGDKTCAACLDAGHAVLGFLRGLMRPWPVSDEIPLGFRRTSASAVDGKTLAGTRAARRRGGVL